MGTRLGRSRHGFIGPTISMWHRMGWWHRHHVAHKPRPGRNRNPVHAARGDITHALASGPGLLGRRQCRHRGPVTNETTALEAGTSDPATGTRSTVPEKP